MIFASWPSPPARAFAKVLTGLVGIDEVLELQPYEARKALSVGAVDLALVPTFDVLRTEDLFDLLPGVGLVGNRSPSQVLAISSPLDQITSVAIDPRFAQEALLSQIILKENYEGKPAFAAVDPSISVSERLAKHDAALVRVEEAPEEGIVLDLGQEWLELTLRPMVWGLLAAGAGEIGVMAAQRIQESLREATEPDSGYQFTLDGYAQEGLEELIQYFFSYGSLMDFPELPFIEIPERADETAEQA